MQQNNYKSDLQQLFSPRLVNLMIAFLVAMLFWQIMDFVAGMTEKGLPFAHPFFRVFGGEGVNGLIKVVAYTAFFYSLLELRSKSQSLEHEKTAFGMDFLPQQDQLVLNPSEVADIKLRVLQFEQRGNHFLLNTLVKKCATQFRNDESISDTIQVLDSQVESQKNLHEGQLEETRYIIQTIPMLGFIGTIIELTRSLAIVSDDSVRGKLLQIMPGYMSKAFDATIVALVLTVILTLRYHKFLEEIDSFFARAKAFVLDNLISRIYRHG